MPPKKNGDDGAPSKPRKQRAPMQRPVGWSNAQWAADVERRSAETRGRAEREMKLQAKRAAAAVADEQARQVSMAWSRSPLAFFQENYGQATRFTPSPPEYEGDQLGGFNPNTVFPAPPPRGPAPFVHNQGSSPSLRRGPLPFSTPGNGSAAGTAVRGMPADAVMHEMISSGSMAAAASPGYFTQEEARATAAVASHSRAAAADDEDEEEDGSQVDEEEEPAEDLPGAAAKGKGRKKRKKDSPPAEPRIKWTGKEEECLAEAWKTVSIDGVTGANQSYETYWKRVKVAFDERKLVDPYFNKMVMVRGEKAMGTHWGIMAAACSKWHGIQEEIDARPESGADFEQKVRISSPDVMLGIYAML